jgi:radical SAM protein with 4Fe4S-binding SPASM domain
MISLFRHRIKVRADPPNWAVFIPSLGLTFKIGKNIVEPSSAPDIVSIAVTSQCPLNCKYCYVERTSYEMSAKRLKRIIENLAEANVFQIAYGGGEPFIRRDFLEIARFTVDVGILPSVTTNGLLINETIASKCADIFSQINVSLNNLEGFVSQVVDDAILKLIDANARVGINVLLTRMSFNRLEEIAEYASSKGIKEIVLLRLKPVGQARSLYQRYRLSNRQVLALYPMALKLLSEYRVNVQFDTSLAFSIYIHKPSKSLMHFLSINGCCAGYDFTSVTASGFIKPCSFSNKIVGNIENFSILWKNSPILHAFRLITSYIKEPCKSCEYLNLCRGGCRVIAETLTDDFFAPDPECPRVINHESVD